MQLISIPDSFLNKTTRQKAALMLFFTAHPGQEFTRLDIIGKMNEEPYRSILMPASGKKGVGPFDLKKGQTKPPTVLRDRLRELVEDDQLLSEKKEGREIFYMLRKEVSGQFFKMQQPGKNDAEMILAMSSSLAQYKELPFSHMLSILAQKARKAVEMDADEHSFQIIDFETPFLTDDAQRSLITTLFYAINDMCIIPTLDYLGSYDSNGKAPLIKIRDFMPYLLKESRGQWYLIGKCTGDKDFRIIPGNRIKGKISPDEDRTFEREQFDPSIYWDGCAGITRIGSRIDVKFEVRNGPKYNNIDYVRMVPLVRNHQKLKPNGEWMIVTLRGIFVGPELVRLIRSFGPKNVRNISPAWLETEIWE
ncbi:WYL domain protein [anaerobic digester metagenome]